MSTALRAVPAQPANDTVATENELATRIVIVGHVDHGKSTLIGRLLHDTGNLPDGRMDAVLASSERRGLKVEWSFLLDSLQAKRDQGVTIDSTRLPFVLDGRPFVIVDAPGHRQLLRNMVTGAAGAAGAVLVVDVAEGAQEQTRRHAVLLRLIGVRHVVVLLNKADLLDFDADRVASATRAITALLEQLELSPAAVIPASARHGDNVASRSARTGWYRGPTLTEALSVVPPPASRAERPLRLPVQDVYRSDSRRIVVGRIGQLRRVRGRRPPQRAGGLLLAWVLERYRFPGRRVLDAAVGLPLALPTAVAGIALTTLYVPDGWMGRLLAPLGIGVALLFVALPFVVRAVQPVLAGLDPAADEAAAILGASPWQAFRLVVLPPLLPAVATGAALGFARAVGEYGSVIFIAGNRPMVSEIVPLLIVTKLEQYDVPGAALLGTAMLLLSFVLLAGIDRLQGRRHAA